MSIDLGTGDGRLPGVLARDDPERLFIGVDANAAALRRWSGRAFRDRVPNLLYVRAAVEDLPAELLGVADRISVVLPWGSLLAAVARPVPALLAGIRRLGRPGARLHVVLGLDPDRDRSESRRLDLPGLDSAHLRGPLPAAYAAAGFRIVRVRRLAAPQMASWPTTWAKRLAGGRPRRVLEIEAVASTTPSAGPAG